MPISRGLFRGYKGDAIIGIDFGLQGAIACVTLDGPAVAHRTPKKRGRYKIDEMADLMKDWSYQFNILQVYVERPQVRPGHKRITGQTLIGMGRGIGIWEGIAVGLGLDVQIVPYQTWQSAMLGGIGGRGSKPKSLAIARGLYPQLQLRDCDDGLADALLIATWGKSRYLADQRLQLASESH